MKPLALLALTISAFAQHPNDVRDRGQTRPADESQSWTRGRLGTQQPIPYKLQEFSGILVDASCDDRSSLNLHEQPARPALAKQDSPTQSAPKVKVDPKT